MVTLITLVLEIIILHIIKSFGVLEVDNVFASILIILFTISFLAYIENSKVFEEFSLQLAIGYFLRLFLLYFDLFGQKIHILPQSGSDSSMFYRTSTELIKYGKTNRSSAFITLMYRVFSFIGINRLYGQFLLMILSIYAIFVFLKILLDLDLDDDSISISAWMICLLPNFALLSSLFLRESLVTLLVTLCIYFMNLWMKGRGKLFFFAALVTSITACIFHAGSIGVTVGCIVCLMMYDSYNQIIHASLSRTLLTIVVAFVISFLLLQYSDLLLAKFINVESIEDIANTSQLGGSSYARYVGNSNTPMSMIVFTIPRIVYFLFSPFPWQWRGISDIIAFFFSGLFYIVTIRNAAVYLLNGNKINRGKIIALLIIASFCTFIFAWGVSNTGTASRHRDKMVGLYGTIFALTMNRNQGGKGKSGC